MKIHRKAKEQFRDIKKKADQGDASSQYKLAKLYAAGNGEKKNSKQSAHYLELSAEQGYFKAQKILVRSFLKKKNADISELIFKWAWVGLELRDVIETLRDLAKRIWETSKGQEDVKLAIRILWKTAPEGDAVSYDLIGRIFASYRKYTWALQNFQEAAKLGHVDARLKIAEFLENGYGCSQDFEAAVECYQKYAKEGNETAGQKLWNIVRRTKKRKELEWIRKATWINKCKEKRVELLLQKAHEWGSSHGKEEAFGAYMAAAIMANAEACMFVGHCYEYGEVVDKNLGHALNYYHIAAQKGISEAYYRIGIICEQLNKNKRALSSYQKAKDANVEYAAEAWKKLNDIVEQEKLRIVNNRLVQSENKPRTAEEFLSVDSKSNLKGEIEKENAGHSDAEAAIHRVNQKISEVDVAQTTEQKEAQATENEQSVEKSIAAPVSEPAHRKEDLPEKEEIPIQRTVTEAPTTVLLQNEAAEAAPVEETIAKEEAEDLPVVEEEALAEEREEQAEQELEEVPEAMEDAVPEVVEEAPLVEFQPELLPDEAKEVSAFEAGAEPDFGIESPPQESFVCYPFIVWVDGVCGMEKPEDLILHSGQGYVEDGAELPVYQWQEVGGPEMAVAPTAVRPWYVHAWQKIKGLLFKKC